MLAPDAVFVFIKISYKIFYNRFTFPYFRHQIREKNCKSKGMRHKLAKFIVIQSRQISKELHCFGYSSVKQRAVCMMNVWGYTEILP